MIFDSETANWIWIALTLGSMLCKLAAAIAHGAAEINGSDPITSGLLEDLRLEVDTELSPDDVSHSNQRAVDAYNNYMREAGNIVGRLEEIQATSAQSLLSFMYWLLVYLITFRVGSTATVLKLATKQLAKAKAAVVNDRLGNP